MCGNRCRGGAEVHKAVFKEFAEALVGRQCTNSANILVEYSHGDVSWD